MKKFCILFVLFLSFCYLFADDDDKIKLAVMEFEDMSGTIEENILANATEYLRVVFASTNRYIIISKDRQKDTIKDMRKKFNTDPSYKACTDKNCQIQLGQALSADLIVKTTVTSFAGSYTLSSELIDLEKEATIIAAKEDYDGSDKALKTAIDKLVEKIVKVETEVNGEIASQEKPKKQKSKAPSSNSKDAAACEYARQKDSSITWKTYIDKYPNGECAEEAIDALDSIACKNAETTNTIKGWKQYLAEFPNGKCEFQATEAVQQFKAGEGGYEADEKLEGFFSGRWNVGPGPCFFACSTNGAAAGVSFSTGFDFNFKVFEKPHGIGAGNLFVGLGFDLVYYYIPGSYDGDMFLSLPIMANFAYEFKTRNKILRYVGILFSAGYGFVWRKEDGDEKYWSCFAWELGMNMIFHNKLTLGLGLGTPMYVPSHLIFNIGTIF